MLKKSSYFYLLLTGTYHFSDKLIGSIFIIYLKSNHLSAGQIGILLSLSSCMTCLLDFPTGNLSDLKGRKKTTLLGLLLFGLGLLIYGLGTQFWSFGLAMLLMGAGAALLTGAKEAWYLDDLEYNKNRDEAFKVFALSNGLSYSLGAIAGIVTTFLIVYHMRLPFLLGGTVSILIGIILFFFTKENYGAKNEKYSDFLKNTGLVFIQDKKVRYFVFVSLLSGSGLVYFILTWQIYLTENGLNSCWLGPIFTLMMTAIGITGFILAKIITYKNCSQIGVISLFLMTASFILMFLIDNLFFCIFALLLFEIALCMKMSSHSAWINQHISSESRASILSAISTFVEAGFAIFFIFLGMIIESFGIRIGYLVPVFGCAGALILFIQLLKIDNHERHEKTRKKKVEK